MTLWTWSRTASANSNADSSINYAEGQAPSSLNDSARAGMAAVAKYRDDISGANITAGTSTAYTITSYQVFDTLAHMNGAMVAFVPHATSGTSPTLNVDGLGGKYIRSAPSVDLPDGALIAGTPYVVTYYNATAEWILQGGAVNPYSIPLGSGIDYWGAAAPNSAFALAYGQAISRTTYASLFTLFGTNYGSGDGSNTFNIPDTRGRVIAGKDNMGGSAASRLTSSYFGTSASTLGAAGGAESHTLTTAQLSAHSHSGTTNNQSSDHAHNWVSPTTRTGTAVVTNGTPSNSFWSGSSLEGTTGVSLNHNHVFATDSAGGGVAHNNVQPTIVSNYIIRVI